MRHLFVRTVLAGLIGLTLLAGSAGQPGRAAAGGVWYDIEVGDNYFWPETIAIVAGDSVAWVNAGAEPHTATGEAFDTNSVFPGEWVGYTFEEPGVYTYSCLLHARMSGTIVVE